MRTVLIRSLLILGLLFIGAFRASAAELICDQSFSPLYLRYDGYHYLQDKVSNPNSYMLYAQSMYAEFSTLGYFVGGGKLDNPVLWDIPAYANNLIMMRSEFPVHIANRPAVRSMDMVRWDIYGQYVLTWDILNTPTTADDTRHVECQPYIITWCGDGVRDTQLDYTGTPYESCDDGTQNGQLGKCNTTCNGTTPPTPVSGICGASNGQTLPSVPMTNLCNSGIPTAVAGSGPWTWSCTGLNGGANSPICSANPLPPPVAWVCSSTVTGPQSSPLSNGSCNLGTVLGFGSTGTNPINYSWSCSGTNGWANSPSCNASYTPPPPPVAWVCSSSVTGPQSAPLSNGSCNLGGVINFAANGINPALYTWNCSGTNSWANSPSCTASYTPPPIPVNGLCSSSVTGPQSAPLRAWVCNSGMVSGFSSIGTNPVNYSWSCIGQNGGTTSLSCTASYTPPPIPVNGVCSSTVTGTQTNPLTTGSCNAGSVLNFLATGANPINYSWTCGWVNGGSNSPTCNANYTPPLTNFSLSIKKYVDNDDAQTVSGAVIKNTGDTFNYVIRVRNDWPASTNGITTVTDTIPAGVVPNWSISAPGWICTGAVSIVCRSSAIITANSYYPDITIPVKVTATSGTIMNIATIENPGCTPVGPTTDPGIIVVPPPPVCSTTYVGALPAPINATTPNLCSIGSSMTFMTFASGTTQNFTWSCKSGSRTVWCNASYTPPTNNFAVSIKKYVNTFDAQTVSGAVILNTGDIFEYILKVKNEWPDPTTGTTTVTDVLPTGVVLVGPISAPGWMCTGTTSIVCTSVASIGANTFFPNITLPMRVTAISGVITNIASVSNPGCGTPVWPTTDPWVIVVPPPSLPPACNSISVNPISGNIPLTSNVSCNVTNATTVAIDCGNGQTFNTSTAICTYTTVRTFVPKCTVNGTITNSSCKGSVTTTNDPPPTSSSVSIKKYAGTLDGQTATGALQVVPGSSFSYRYDVSNTGAVAATGVVVTDTFPQYITVASVTPPAGWTCTRSTKIVATITYATVICTTPSLAAGTTVSINVGATLSLSTPATAQLRNIVYVCKAGDTATPNCTPTCTDPTNPTCTPPPPPPDCSPIPQSPNYDPACVVPPPSIVRSCDMLTSLPSGSTLSPSIDVTYTCTATGAIAVPANLEYSIKCGVGDISTGSTFTGSNIRICRTPSTTATTQTMTCAVRDRTTGVVFSGSEIGTCKVTKMTSGGSSTSILYVPKCVNGSPTCATTGNYPDTALCKIGEWRDCYTNQAACDAVRWTLSCGWGGCSGPTCGSCVWPGCSNGWGYCGDGVLQTGEECDVYGVTWCGQRWERDYLGNSIECQIKGLTTPGANPITDLWMTIPKLSKGRLGYTFVDSIWLDREVGKIRFEDNGMVLGVNTRAFTIADTVGFGIKRAYSVPLTVEATKRICLTSTGTSMNSNTLCTNFGDLVPVSMKFTVPATGAQYVLIGNGDYQVRQLDGTYRQYTVTGNPNNIDLFRGANTYSTTNGTMKLYDGFYARQIISPADGVLSLYHRSISTGEPIDLAALRVRVSGVMVGGTSSTVNRKLEDYINSTSLVSIFLSGFKGYTTTTSSTNAIGVGSASAVNTVNINTTNAPIWGAIILGTTGLASYKLNGNDTIYSVKGNVIMNCTSGVTATELQGVRTLIVENGDLTINCNNGYGSSDISSSWAFIVKNGNIRVASGVTNIAWVYVTIGTPAAGACGGTGNVCSVGNTATNNILRLNGSMYGNAKPLFDSRLYVRGTNAYDILTTGMVISYSNRALVNPPPLLSQYLNNYNVVRVVK